MNKSNRIECKNIALKLQPDFFDSAWDDSSTVELLDNISAEKPRLKTKVSIFRDDEQKRLFLRFVSDDDEIISNYRRNNETIYNQDVMEFFVSEDGNLKKYKEFELSPYDIHFGGTISFAEHARRLEMNIDMYNFSSKTKFFKEKKLLCSVWSLPYSIFSIEPKKGVSFRINLFRIDMENGKQNLQAWQATGVNNFHVPEKFGFLDFV